MLETGVCQVLIPDLNTFHFGAMQRVVAVKLLRE